MKLIGNPFNRPLKALLVLGFTLAIGASTLPAQTTLAGLTNGGSLTIDDKTFTGFWYQATGLTGFDPNQIYVSVSQTGGVDYLTWSGNMSLSGSYATSDLILRYIVTANPGSINMIDQYYIGVATNGFLAVDETAAIGAFGGTVVGFSHLEVGDFGDPPAEAIQGDSLNINPSQSVLYVTKDISFAVLDGGTVSLSEVVQSFHQVPEPGTMLLGCLGGGLLLILRSRYQNRRG